MGEHSEMPRNVQDLFANQAEVLSLGKLRASYTIEIISFYGNSGGTLSDGNIAVAANQMAMLKADGDNFTNIDLTISDSEQWAAFWCDSILLFGTQGRNGDLANAKKLALEIANTHSARFADAAAGSGTGVTADARGPHQVLALHRGRQR